jgi:hypothetical protein
MMPVDTARVPGRHAVSDFAWALPLAIAGTALLAGGKLFGGPLALPVLSIALLAAGFAVAAGLYLLRRHVRQGASESAWLLAAALVLLGFAGALLSDGNAALIALDGMHTGLTVAAGK